MPVLGSKAVGGGAVGGEAVGRLLTAVVDVAVMWEAAHFLWARTFFAVFFQISSMVAEIGNRRAQRSQTETTHRQWMENSRQ